MNKGLVTTLLSDITLVGSMIILGQKVTTDLYVQLGMAAGALVIAYLDIKYPEGMAKVKELLEKLNEAQAMASQSEEAKETVKEGEFLQ